MKFPYEDAKYVVAAVIMAATLFIVKLGFGWGWYVGMAYLAFNSGVVILASAVMLNPDVFPQSVKGEKPYRNHMLQFLVHAITAVCLYYMAAAGYTFAVGFFTFMLVVSVCSNTLTAMDKRKG